MNNWIKTKDSLPPPESMVMVVANWGKEYGSIFIMYYGLTHKGDLDWYYDDEITKPYMKPTHWMYLPELPENPTI